MHSVHLLTSKLVETSPALAEDLRGLQVSIQQDLQKIEHINRGARRVVLQCHDPTS